MVSSQDNVGLRLPKCNPYICCFIDRQLSDRWNDCSFCIFTDCRHPQPSFIPSLYAGYANVFNVNCRQSTDFTKKAFVVHWEQPKGITGRCISHGVIHCDMLDDTI